jgi:hypothetical protein
VAGRDISYATRVSGEAGEDGLKGPDTVLGGLSVTYLLQQRHRRDSYGRGVNRSDDNEEFGNAHARN